MADQRQDKVRKASERKESAIQEVRRTVCGNSVYLGNSGDGGVQHPFIRAHKINNGRIHRRPAKSGVRKGLQTHSEGVAGRFMARNWVPLRAGNE